MGDFGRDPVDALRQPVSFSIITQVDTAYQLDTARPRYDGTVCYFSAAWPDGGELTTPFGVRQPQFGYFPVILPHSTKILTKCIFILH